MDSSRLQVPNRPLDGLRDLAARRLDLMVGGGPHVSRLNLKRRTIKGARNCAAGRLNTCYSASP